MAELKWTTDRPTTPGTYLMTCFCCRVLPITIKLCDESHIIIAGCNVKISDLIGDYYWMGPILSPEDDANAD